MNQLQLPEPQYVSFKAKGYSQDERECVTPYASLDWTKIVSQYGVKVPEIVDMTCGFSKCQECKATYAGYQRRCSKMVDFHMLKGGWHYQCGHNGHADTNVLKECEGYLTWDHRERFDSQKRFFEVLIRISYLPDLSQDPLFEFQDSFAPGAASALRERLLRRDIESIQIQLPMITGAIKQIAEKMNAAGNSLSFGF
jgi:hypothetical protein